MSGRFLFVCFLLALSGCASRKAAQDAGTAAVDRPGSAKAELSASKKSSGVAADEQSPQGGGNVIATSAADSENPFLEDGQEEPPPSSRSAIAAAERLLKNKDLDGATRVVEKALSGHPEDINLLLFLAQLNFLANDKPEKPDQSKRLAAAEYLRRALKLEPRIGEDPRLRSLSGFIYYNEACALAITKKPEEALQSLGDAIDFGFQDFAQIEKDSELESVRALPQFPTLLAKAREAHQERLKAEVEELFANTKPFDFDFELTDIEGNPISKAEFSGKVLIVDVWGTWCQPCRMEIPHFVALQKKFQDAEFAIVGLNSEQVANEKEALKLVQKFHKDNGMNYRCALAPQDTIEQIPNLEGFPTTLFLDRSGKVRVRAVGYHPYELLEMIVQKLLDQKAEPSQE